MNRKGKFKILNCTLGSSDEKQAQYTKGYEQLRDR